MKRLNLLLSLGCVAISFSAGAASLGQTSDASQPVASTTSTSDTSFLDNQSLEHTSEKILKRHYPSGSFSTVAYDNNVLLLGQVPTKANKKSATGKIKALPKVANVWNYLEVGKKVDAKQVTKDSYLTTAAKTLLVAQKEVNTNNIKVVTENSSIYLLGKDIGNPTELQNAIAGMKDITGVKKVINLTEK